MNINTDININARFLSIKEKLYLIEEILESIDEEGIIDDVRKLVNDKKYDDQPPAK